MRRNVLSSVACLVLLIFFHIITQKTQFSKKKLLNTKYVLIFFLQLLSETFLILREFRDILP